MTKYIEYLKQILSQNNIKNKLGVSLRIMLTFMVLFSPLYNNAQVLGNFKFIVKDAHIKDQNDNRRELNTKEISMAIGNGICLIETDDNSVQINEYVFTRLKDSAGSSRTDDGPWYYSIGADIKRDCILIESQLNPENLVGNNDEMPDKYDAKIFIGFQDGYRYWANINMVIDMDAYNENGNLMTSTIGWVDFLKRFITICKTSKENDAKTRQAISVAKLDKSVVAQPVDLGLSVKWASHNIGEWKPMGNVCEFGWGDPTGENASEYNETFPDTKTIIYNISSTEYDIAKSKWGANWRLPTKEEAKELISKCKLELIKDSEGNEGVKLIGPNGNSIYLPFDVFSDYGQYWTGTREKVCCGAFAITIGSTYRETNEHIYVPAAVAHINDSNNRFCKFFIRPVYCK